MYCQLGNIRFEGVNSFAEQNRSDTTNYAQYDLINIKPRLQPTGNNLEQITLAVKLRADFVSVEDRILALKKSKDEFEVLPLLMGTGRYLGDYVITELVETVITAFGDGAILEASLQLTLLEYVVPDKLQQQQAAARKQAFAVGDRRPIAVFQTQQPTVAQQAAINVSEAKAQASVIDTRVAQYEQNVTQRPDIANQIADALVKMNAGLTDLHTKIATGQISGDLSNLEDSLNGVLDAINVFEIPVPDLSVLQLNNRTLQAAMKIFKAASRVITNPVILRAA